MEQLPKTTQVQPNKTALTYFADLARGLCSKNIPQGYWVVAFDCESKFAIGSAAEAQGTVEAYDPKFDSYCIIFRPPGGRVAEYIHWRNVLNTDNLHKVLQNIPDEILPQPKFKVDDIVYVISKQKAGPENPVLGSDYESDTKILNVTKSKYGLHYVYSVFIPGFGSRNYQERDLIGAPDKLRHIHADFEEKYFSMDALPFFERNEKVQIYGGVVHNMTNTVNVPLTTELSNYLINTID